MTFTVGTLTRCAGQNHYAVTLTFASGATATLRFNRGDLDLDPAADVSAAREAILDRLRSAGKEAGASTFAQWRTALETKTFKV